jgi:uncharacterized repeat protein (TIGR04076 family)
MEDEHNDDRYDVQITVVKINKGKCFQGHKVGKTWICQKDKTPEGLCIGAFNAMIPQLRTLIHGGSHYWDRETNPKGDLSYVSCPDRNVLVEYELKRLRND